MSEFETKHFSVRSHPSVERANKGLITKFTQTVLFTGANHHKKPRPTNCLCQLQYSRSELIFMHGLGVAAYDCFI